jgi:hypothetical protein
MGDLKTDVATMKTDVADTKSVTDDVKKWKMMGMGALGVTGIAAGAVASFVTAYWTEIAKLLRGGWEIRARRFRAICKRRRTHAQMPVQRKEPERERLNLVFWPMTSASPENDAFYKYTPAGKQELSTINAEAAAGFEVGKAYYLDFTPAG